MPKHADVIIDQTLPDPNTGVTRWRVYYWAERPDSAGHSEDDQFHWHPDSEHETEAAAKKRAAELKKGGKRQSILALAALDAAMAARN